ncbi:MAG: lipoprotein insertase outer membrane protein LolB [Arsenophonus sp. ET-KM2-MAG3]
MTFIMKHFLNLRHYYFKFILLFVIFLTACKFNQQLTTKKNNLISNQLWINHQQQLIKLKKFETRGSFVYIDVNNKIYTNFFWQQYAISNYCLLFTNPLGRTELKLNITPHTIKIVDREGKKYVNNHPTQLIYQLTGMKIPIENLSYWLIGLPINVTSFTLDKRGLLKTIEYRKNGKNWHLNYFSYYQFSQPKLPSYIELTQDKQRIILKMHSWILKK